jgi:LmbE family N-acetylglucosaminyl deacetylase
VATQHFEHGAEGVRLLDLSALSGFPRDRPLKITLHGRHLDWEPQSREIVLFDNRMTRAPRVLIVAPHPDDAEIAAFGLYSRYAGSRVITITAGDSGPKWYGYLLPDDAQHFAMKARLRVWDSIAIPQLGGVAPENAVNLGYFDGMLQSMFERPQEEVRARHVDTRDVMTFRRHNVANLTWLGAPRATWKNLVSDLTRLLAAAAPDIVVAPHPMLDGHPDHVFSAIAVMEAMAAAGLTSKLYLYGAHVVHADEFPLGPPDSNVGVPPWFDAKAPFRGLHSVPLDRDRQLLKLFVLEAMHDFRRGPPPPQGNLRESAISTVASLRRLFADLVGGEPTDYYRKAARPNELFFVYAGQDACMLRDTALRARGIEPASACETRTP